jgi:hypothetical protein
METISRIRRAGCNSKVFGMAKTDDERDECVAGMLEAGADGVLEKVRQTDLPLILSDVT